MLLRILIYVQWRQLRMGSHKTRWVYISLKKNPQSKPLVVSQKVNDHKYLLGKDHWRVGDIIQLCKIKRLPFDEMKFKRKVFLPNYYCTCVRESLQNWTLPQASEDRHFIQKKVCYPFDEQLSQNVHRLFFYALCWDTLEYWYLTILKGKVNVW